jgi:hypothetical protein
MEGFWYVARMVKLTLNDGHDGALLDGRWTLKTVGINAAKKFGLEVHRIEGVDSLVIIRLDLAL